jgi:short-subunit dehydrogenase
MSYDLQGKTVLITGSTDGLGRKLALELARRDVNVVVHGRSQEKIDPIIQELKLVSPKGVFSSVVCDLNQPSSIAQSFSSIKHLDILVNNAGVWQEGDTIKETQEKIIQVMNVNLGAVMLVTCSLLPTLLKAEFSQILCVSSVAGVTLPEGYFHTIYTATKWGVQAFSEALQKEYDNKKLRVMGYYPGGMETKLFVKGGIAYKDHEPWMFDPQESVEAILFMLTRDPKINVKRMDLINHLEQ